MFAGPLLGDPSCLLLLATVILHLLVAPLHGASLRVADLAGAGSHKYLPSDLSFLASEPDSAASEEEVEAVTWLASLELGGSTTQSSSGSRDLAATPLPPPTPATPPMTRETSQGYFLLSKINYTDTTVALL